MNRQMFSQNPHMWGKSHHTIITICLFLWLLAYCPTSSLFMLLWLAKQSTRRVVCVPIKPVEDVSLTWGSLEDRSVSSVCRAARLTLMMLCLRNGHSRGTSSVRDWDRLQTAHTIYLISVAGFFFIVWCQTRYSLSVRTFSSQIVDT